MRHIGAPKYDEKLKTAIKVRTIKIKPVMQTTIKTILTFLVLAGIIATVQAQQKAHKMTTHTISNE